MCRVPALSSLKGEIEKLSVMTADNNSNTAKALADIWEATKHFGVLESGLFGFPRGLHASCIDDSGNAVSQFWITAYFSSDSDRNGWHISGWWIRKNKIFRT